MKRRKTLKVLTSLSLSSLIGMHHLNFDFNSMIKREVPKTGAQIPIVGLGTWQTFDVGNNAEERKIRSAVLKALVDAGASVVDSSPMYGSSERVVGDLATALEINDKLFMATKVWTSGREAGIRQMKQSMAKMQKPKMDLMQIHNLVDWKTHMRTLQDWKAEGRIKHIGITHYLESAYGRLESIMKDYPIDFVQLNYSIKSRDAENRLLPLAKDKGIAVLVNGPYESGSLFRTTRGKELPEWAAAFDCESWGQFFLKYILSNEAVTCVIPGTSKVSHLTDNMKAGMGRMPDAKTRKMMIDLLR